MWETIYILIGAGTFLHILFSNGRFAAALFGGIVWPVTWLLWIKENASGQ